MGGHWGFFLPMAVIIVAMIFKFISSTVEEFLAPSIAAISEWLKLPEALGKI
jgi:hypothetical protein